jgi:hypothetical protein
MRELFLEFGRDDAYYQFEEVEIIGNIYEKKEQKRTVLKGERSIN